jgi:hypothetical protein
MSDGLTLRTDLQLAEWLARRPGVPLLTKPSTRTIRTDHDLTRPFQAIQVEEDRVVCIRFGHDWDPDCMVMDETLYSVQAKVQNYAVMYLGAFDIHVATRFRRGSR